MKVARAMQVAPARTIAEGSLSSHGKILAVAARPHPRSDPPSSLPMLSSRVGTRFGRHLRGGMQIFVKTKSNQDQKWIGRQPSPPKNPPGPPARSLPGKPAHHCKTLVGSPDKTLAKRTGKATARPAPAKFPPSFARSCQPSQLNRHLRGSMQSFVKAPPPRHLSCLPAYMARHASLAGVRVEAKRSGDGRDGPRPRPR